MNSVVAMVRFGAPRRESHRGLGDDDERHFPVPMAAAQFAQRDTRRHIASQHCLPIPLHCLCAAPLVDPVVGGALSGSGSASSFRPTLPWNEFHDEKALAPANYHGLASAHRRSREYAFRKAEPTAHVSGEFGFEPSRAHHTYFEFPDFLGRLSNRTPMSPSS